MKDFKIIGQQIYDLVTDPVEEAKRSLLGIYGARFIICGKSGSGKTSAINMANDLLPGDEQIAESDELLTENDVSRALEIFHDAGLGYENSKHIGFSVLRSPLAKSLEAKGVSIFWMGN